MKTKKFFIIALILFASQTGYTQSKSYKMYDAFSNKDGISSLSFSKNMIDAINLDLGDDGEKKTVTGDLHEIRFMSYNPEKGDLTGPQFMNKAKDYLPKSVYHKFENDDEDSNTEIWLMGGKKKFSECHVFVKNENDEQMQFVVSFYGDFTVNDLEKLRKTGTDFSEEKK